MKIDKFDLFIILCILIITLGCAVIGVGIVALASNKEPVVGKELVHEQEVEIIDVNAIYFDAGDDIEGIEFISITIAEPRQYFKEQDL